MSEDSNSGNQQPSNPDDSRQDVIERDRALHRTRLIAYGAAALAVASTWAGILHRNNDNPERSDVQHPVPAKVVEADHNPTGEGVSFNSDEMTIGNKTIRLSEISRPAGPHDQEK